MFRPCFTNGHGILKSKDGRSLWVGIEFLEGARLREHALVTSVTSPWIGRGNPFTVPALHVKARGNTKAFNSSSKACLLMTG